MSKKGLSVPQWNKEKPFQFSSSIATHKMWVSLPRVVFPTVWLCVLFFLADEDRVAPVFVKSCCSQDASVCCFLKLFAWSSNPVCYILFLTMCNLLLSCSFVQPYEMYVIMRAAQSETVQWKTRNTEMGFFLVENLLQASMFACCKSLLAGNIVCLDFMDA